MMTAVQTAYKGFSISLQKYRNSCLLKWVEYLDDTNKKRDVTLEISQINKNDFFNRNKTYDNVPPKNVVGINICNLKRR